jgi:hypothetical protein
MFNEFRDGVPSSMISVTILGKIHANSGLQSFINQESL